MARMISHWNVLIATSETVANNLPSICVGMLNNGRPDIVCGYLLYMDLHGNHAGINLSECLSFTIEPQFADET